MTGTPARLKARCKKNASVGSSSATRICPCSFIKLDHAFDPVLYLNAVRSDFKWVSRYWKNAGRMLQLFMRLELYMISSGREPGHGAFLPVAFPNDLPESFFIA